MANQARYQVIYGKYEAVEKRAVEIVCETVSTYVEYTLPALPACETDESELGKAQPIFVGTPDSNPYIREFAEKGLLHLPVEAEGYTVKVMQSVFHPAHQMVVIAGCDPVGAVYGAIDWKSYDIPAAEHNFNHHTYFDKIFAEKALPEYERSSAPKIRHRGLWSWGHVIYDYRGYIENMMRLKMNTLIVWNDFLPVNIKEILEYAHGCGVKVICGYAWGWDTNQFQSDELDLSDQSVLKKIEDEIIAKYEAEYSELGIDGIYFQSFTETDLECANGEVIADIVVRLVNAAAKRLYDKNAELELLFGLHATSVSQKLEYIKNTDPRIHIVWEDCGAFPYAYLPGNIEAFDKTLSFTDEITSLRGEQEKFGAVLKGLICLNWESFEHQSGPFVMGCSSKQWIKKRAQKREKIWNFVTSYWLENASYAGSLMRRIAKNTKGETVVTALVEDGMFEYKIPLPVALMAELMWDSSQPVEQLLRLVALREDVRLQG